MGSGTEIFKNELIAKSRMLEDENAFLRKEERSFTNKAEEEEERVRLQRKKLEEIYESTDDSDIKLIIEQKIERMEYSSFKRRSLIEDVLADLSVRIKKNSKAKEAIEEELKKF